MKKGIFSVMLAGAMLAATALTPLTAWAESPASSQDSKITYDAGDGYKFEKISHPTKDTKSADGIVDYLGNGKVGIITDPDDPYYNAGDRGQSYSWSALSYGDWLYVGTCYAAMGNTLTLMDSTLGDKFDKDVMEAALKAMFNGTFFFGQEKPDGTADTDSNGILVKVNTKTGEMKLLMSEFQTNADNNTYSPLFRNGISYNGKLYFCGSVRVNGARSGLPSVFEIDPETDECKAVYVGLNNASDSLAAYRAGISTGIRGMCVYNGELIISNVYMDSSTGENGAVLLASSNPSEGFRVIATQEDMFNYPAYHYTDSIYGGSVWDMAEYNGHLYVSICTGTADNAPDSNTMQSFAIIRGDENDDGTFSWTPLVGSQRDDDARYPFGIDPERTRSGAANLIVYNNKLYIGEYNDEEIALERILFNKTGDSADGSLGGVDCRFVNANLNQSVSLYAMDENEDITLIVGDATEKFPEGGVSGLGSGFGHNENQYIWRMQVYDGKLYVGTFDTSSLLEPIGQFSNGDIIGMTPEQWKTQLQYIRELLKLLKDKDNSPDTQQAKAAATPETAVFALPGEPVEENDATVETAEDEQNAFLYDADALTEEMAAMPDILNNDTSAATLSAEGETTDREQSLQEFLDYYTAMLDTYNELNASYNLSDDLQQAFGKLLNTETQEKIKSVLVCLGYLRTASRGFDLYVSEDGIHFQTLTTSGFGDPYNHGLRVFAVTNQGLCLGTANPFYGTQLWIQRKETPTEPTPTPSTTPATVAPTAAPTPAPTAESKAVSTSVKGAAIPQTSDEFPLAGIALLSVASAAAMAGLTVYRRKRSK